MRTLRIPAVLAVATLGCGDKDTIHDAAVRDAAVSDTGVATSDSGPCNVFCFPDGSDAGVCPDNPFVCVSADRMCPAGCECSVFCMPRTPEGEMNCPHNGGYMCAAPDRTCPTGCDPIG